jgi:hypothetical protein
MILEQGQALVRAIEALETAGVARGLRSGDLAQQ